MKDKFLHWENDKHIREYKCLKVFNFCWVLKQWNEDNIGLVKIIINNCKQLNFLKIDMDDDRDFKVRIDKAAKNYRLLKRADVFERNRKNVRE